jgi:hypothetical protein
MKMLTSRSRITFLAGLASTGLAILLTMPLQSGQQKELSKKSSSRAPKRDLSGVWQYLAPGGSEGLAPDKEMPPMTPWARTKYDAEKPGFGPRAAPNGNDPILHCDPMGFPRVMFFLGPFEFVNAQGRVLQFFEREHEWRPIWTDGRPLPKDHDPTWYGYAIGRWESDDTFVVESSGFNDKTWLGATGYPHTEDMHVTERYHRVDYDTILYDITVTDAKAYIRPIVAPSRIMKLRPHQEIEELLCVSSDELEFSRRINEPATQPAK